MRGEKVLQYIWQLCSAQRSPPSNDAAAAKAPTRAPPKSAGGRWALEGVHLRAAAPASTRKHNGNTGPGGPTDFCEAACDAELHTEMLNTG